VLGPGFGTIQLLVSPGAAQQMSVWLLLTLPLAKIAATSLSIGTGGPGGVFGPGLLIGAATGVAVWRVFSPLGIAPEGPVVFTVIGMAACLGAIIHAPLGVTILVLESTRSPGLLLPTAVAMAGSCWLVGDQTLYRSQEHADGYRIVDPVRALYHALPQILTRRHAHANQRLAASEDASHTHGVSRVSN
jgi:CIC family chloride channel protein